MIIEKQKEIQSIYNEIMQCKSISFADLKPSLLEEVAGVYVIFDKMDKTLYVGRTKNLRKRLYLNQLNGNAFSSAFKKYLLKDNGVFENKDGTMSSARQWIKENCYLKYIKVSDSRKRGQIEGLLSFIFDVKYIEDEH